MTDDKAGYNRFLLLVAGLGGLLYGVDVGIIGGALPYLDATSKFTASQLSTVVAAVLLGSVISTLFAGVLADSMGRKPLMILSGLLFVFSIPMIALSHSYGSLVLGRLLQGTSGGDRIFPERWSAPTRDDVCLGMQGNSSPASSLECQLQRQA